MKAVWNFARAAVLVLAVAPAGAQVVVSQIYGGGGNTGATLRNDFIELFNRGAAPVDLTGWTVQYASSAGSTWQATALAGVIQPGRYYLVQQAAGAGGTVNLPAPDAMGGIFMGAASGKVALVGNAAVLSGACPAGASIADFVGYGSAANCFEGGGPTATLTNTTAALRAGSGCIDTDNNAGDFAVGSPLPRNSAAPAQSCGAPVPTHTISQIQGSGPESPLKGTFLQTRGIVTARKSNGYFIQTPDNETDGDPSTSEGLFVFTSSAPPATALAGNLLQVTGTVAEFRPSSDPSSLPLTELTGPSATLISSGNSLPASVALTASSLAPGGGLDQLERYEGMRVAVSTLTVTAPTGGSISEANAASTSNGVFYGVITGTARPFREPGIDAHDPLPAGSPCCVPRFDSNPENLRVDSDGQTGAAALDAGSGAVVTGLAGVLDYGSRSYTLLPDPGTGVVSGGPSVAAVGAATAGEATVATFNMQRFFDTADDAGTSDAVLTPAAFDRRLGKVSQAIRNALRMPDILAVQEVENLATLETIAARVSSDAAAAGQPDPQYAAYLVEGNDVGGIDSGFLVKRPAVTVLGVEQVGKNATYINPQNGQAETLHDRPPLVLTSAVQAPGSPSPLALTVMVNHFRSLTGVESPADGDRVRAKRKAQAEYVAQWLQARQSADPLENILMLGDLNAFQFNDGYVDVVGTTAGAPAPVSEVVAASADLVDPDFANLAHLVPAGQRYTYVFQGDAQVLDHILVSSAALPRVTRFAHARFNADFAETLRNDASRPERISDHDAPVAYLYAGQELTGEVEIQRTPVNYVPGLGLHRT